MNACPRRVDLAFHGIEAWCSWDLTYDESRATPIGHPLSVHPGFAFFSRKRPGTFWDVMRGQTYVSVRSASWDRAVERVSKISRLTRRQTLNCGRSSRERRARVSCGVQLGRSRKTLRIWLGKDRLKDQAGQRAKEVWRWQNVRSDGGQTDHRQKTKSRHGRPLAIIPQGFGRLSRMGTSNRYGRRTNSATFRGW